WRRTWEVRLPLLVIGGTFASVQFLWSNYVGFELVDIASSVSSLFAGVIAIRLWRPRETWRFETDVEPVASSALARPEAGASGPDRLGARRVARAWMPFALLTVAVLVWGIPAIEPLGTPAVKEW